MAYFFNAPDFYGMEMAKRNQFDKQVDDFVQSGPFMQYARYKIAEDAKAREAKRDEREQELHDLLMARFRGSQQQPQQPEQERQQAGAEAVEAPAMIDVNSLTPEQLQQIQKLQGGQYYGTASA
jgi:hypothetical protein